MKFALAALALVFSASVASAAPGSYSVLTFALTASQTVDVPDAVLKNGNKQQGLATQTVKVTNATILAEAQSQGYLSAGSLDGWQVVAVHDADDFRGFFARKAGQSVAIPGVIQVLDGYYGSSEAGKWVRNTGGDLISGKNTTKEVAFIRVTLGGVDYVSTVLLTTTEQIYNLGTGPFWAISAAWKSSAFAAAGEDGTTMAGTVSGRPAVRLAVIEAEFPALASSSD